jgi:hypothetical protein
MAGCSVPKFRNFVRQGLLNCRCLSSIKCKPLKGLTRFQAKHFGRVGVAEDRLAVALHVPRYDEGWLASREKEVVSLSLQSINGTARKRLSCLRSLPGPDSCPRALPPSAQPRCSADDAGNSILRPVDGGTSLPAR